MDISELDKAYHECVSALNKIYLSYKSELTHSILSQEQEQMEYNKLINALSLQQQC